MFTCDHSFFFVNFSLFTYTLISRHMNGCQVWRNFCKYLSYNKGKQTHKNKNIIKANKKKTKKKTKKTKKKTLFYLLKPTYLLTILLLNCFRFVFFFFDIFFMSCKTCPSSSRNTTVNH